MSEQITVGIILKAASAGAEKALRAFGAGAAKVFAAASAAALAAGGAIAALTARAAALAGKFLDVSERTGASTEFLSQMGFAAKQSGSSLGAIEKALSTVSKNAVTGSKSFEKWGVSAKNANGTTKTSEQLFASAAERLSKLKSSTAQMAAAQDLFGKAGKELLPVLRGGADGLKKWAEQADAAGVTIDSLSARLGDELGDQMDAVKDQTDALTVQLGQFFMPIAIALTKQVRAVVGEIIGWVKANKQLIDEKLTAFLIWIADSALPAIAVGVDLVAKVWLGWKILFQTLQFLAAAFVSGVLEGFSAVAGGAAKLAAKLGADGIAAELEAIARDSSAMAGQFENDADKASASMAATASEIKSTETAIGNFGATASGALRQAVADAAALKSELAAMGPTGNVDTASGEIPAGPGKKQKKPKVTAHDPFIKNAGESNAAEKARLKALKDEQKAVQNLQQQYEQLASTIANALGQAFMSIIDGSKSVGDAMRDLVSKGISMMLDWAIQQITAAAATSAAGGFSSGMNSGIPYPWNLLAAASAAATALAATLAFKGKLHVGGVVPGPRGREQMMLVQGGEKVSSIAEQRAQEQRERNDRSERARMRDLHIHTLAVPSRAETERTFEDRVMPVVDRMSERGSGFGRRNRRPLLGRG